MAYTRFIKPLFDYLVSATLLIVLSPVMLLIMVLLAVAQRGHIFFLQKRVGYHERIFTIVKFKTMNDRRDDDGHLLPDAQRLTRIGRFVRKTSLDELPQLINVLKGDMSFIGPRPLLVEYLPLYNLVQRTRHRVKPGITGWAQVNGRNAISWEQRLAYDAWYVVHCSWTTDLKILYLTAIKVVRAEGISAEGSATMEKFKGTPIMNKIAIVGAGGFGREVEMLIEQINQHKPAWDFVGYYDDGKLAGTPIGRKKVLGNVEDLANVKDPLSVVIAVGDPITKKNIWERIFNRKNISAAVLIHPSVPIGRNVTIGEGSIICYGNIITVDIVIGRHVILNLACTVGHDTVIGDFCSVMPGVNISGEVIMKEGVYLGTGAKIINQLTLEAYVTVGSGAVVTKNLPAGVTAVGIPAKPLGGSTK